ncbi:hypothetical protein CCAX7_60520 [Capsulimonas corticalis]|uniref:Uncharacterized protein n=1 Tax=Capsulimonas corticalis TaxID=2219043 RepID=A0A402CW12_9BACT|nr:hypothetical protein CCAX7_60520 [Capsulimonas corticalis]
MVDMEQLARHDGLIADRAMGGHGGDAAEMIHLIADFGTGSIGKLTVLGFGRSMAIG